MNAPAAPATLSRIDLHTHSRASDGTEPPAALVAEAVRTRLDVVAITDHDTFAGWGEAQTAADQTALELVPGIEISCFARESGYRISLHLLGYWPDPQNGPLGDALAELRDSRDTRAAAMLQKIQAAGYAVSWDELLADAAGGVVGRPHVARALVRAGLIPDVSSAFTPEWIGGRGARFYVDKLELPVAEAVSLLRAAGGVPVFAHPRAVKRGPTISDDTLRQLTADGLVGVEIDHPDHDARARAELRTLAAELGLIATGSSDWHGANKPTPMGAELTDPQAFAALKKVGAEMVGFDTALFGQVSVTLAVIMDPLGSVPLFLALTKNRTPKRRALAAYQAVLVALAVISVFAIFGRQILDYLGITVPALQGSGGLLLLLVALELLTGKESPQEEVTDVNVALVPLGTPLLAGPGAIVATIVFVQGAHGSRDALAIVAGVLVVHVVLALVLRFSVVLLKILKDGGITLLTRVFGLLLSAIAVQLVAEGVTGFIDAHHH